jgi:hypothetical protein
MTLITLFFKQVVSIEQLSIEHVFKLLVLDDCKISNRAFIYFQDDIMLHPDFEMNSPDFKEMSDNEKESPAKELNNSIRKKLFDQNDNDNDDCMMGTDSPK